MQYGDLEVFYSQRLSHNDFENQFEVSTRDRLAFNFPFIRVNSPENQCELNDNSSFLELMEKTSIYGSLLRVEVIVIGYIE